MAEKRKALDREERDRQLLDVAASVFAERGFRNASVAAITERAGVAHGTFYNYFESKEDVFLQLIELYFRQFETIVEENHDRIMKAISGGGDVVAAWRENALSVFAFHADNPALTAVIYREAVGTGKRFAARMDKLSGLSKRRLAEEFGLLMSRRAIIDFDTELLIFIINGTILGTIVEWILIRQTEDLEWLAENFVKYHIRALSPAARKQVDGERRSGTIDRRRSGVPDRRASGAGDRRDGGPEDRRRRADGAPDEAGGSGR